MCRGVIFTAADTYLRRLLAAVYADEDGPEVRPVPLHERGRMANRFNEGDHIIIKQRVLSGTTSDEVTRVFRVTRDQGGSQVHGYPVCQGPAAVQPIDRDEDIERRADDREVRMAESRRAR